MSGLSSLDPANDGPATRSPAPRRGLRAVLVADVAGYTGLMEKLVSTGSYLDSKAFGQTIVSTYREMGKLIPTLGLKQN